MVLQWYQFTELDSIQFRNGIDSYEIILQIHRLETINESLLVLNIEKSYQGLFHFSMLDPQILPTGNHYWNVIRAQELQAHKLYDLNLVTLLVTNSPFEYLEQSNNVWKWRKNFPCEQLVYDNIQRKIQLYILFKITEKSSLFYFL